MVNKYSKLAIDPNKLYSWINLWCEENLTGNFDIEHVERKDRIQYTINNNDIITKIDFQKCAGGLWTICPKVGKNISQSEQIAESIYIRVKNIFKDSPFAHGYSIILTQSDFDTLISLLSEMENVTLENYSIKDEEHHAKYRLYKFKSSNSDSITIKYYPTTSRMQMQGKPLYLFNEVIAMLGSNIIKQDDVVDASLKYCNINLKAKDIYTEMETVLGSNLYNFLSQSQKIILSTSFILNKIDGNLGDYSILFQPANRTYEGFLKKIYAQEGLECDGDHQLGKFFEWPDHVNPTMKMEYASKLAPDIVDGFTSMFKFYSLHRHPYMHASAYDYNTQIIENREVATEKLNEILYSMKTWYKWYFNKN